MFENMMYYALGLGTYPAALFIYWICYLLRFAFKDTWRVVRYGKLKEGKSKFTWLWIVPKVFLHSMWDTATMPGKRVS